MTNNEQTSPKVGIYAGSFDPFTIGHVDIVQRALRLVDTLHIVIGVNPRKASFIPSDERLKTIQELYSDNPHIVVALNEGLPPPMPRPTVPLSSSEAFAMSPTWSTSAVWQTSTSRTSDWIRYFSSPLPSLQVSAHPSSASSPPSAKTTHGTFPDKYRQKRDLFVGKSYRIAIIIP
ncbi:adenylyltransferase/cytidyltransferase family protein [Porphyromonas cangingivalis]|uniref:adenylyltransferase/cytidyltransferase family protein n=1 Tax=Porphyromonas cangingivalis TaxID=36874 RepID=UPI001F3C75CF|nr:adenylyltransferase/cytidyltransferase family protein [Porphyromonas cangingivalis]